MSHPRWTSIFSNASQLKTYKVVFCIDIAIVSCPQIEVSTVCTTAFETQKNINANKQYITTVSLLLMH